jgi:hypothetical protein
LNSEGFLPCFHQSPIKTKKREGRERSRKEKGSGNWEKIWAEGIFAASFGPSFDPSFGPSFGSFAVQITINKSLILMHSVIKIPSRFLTGRSTKSFARVSG